MTNELARLYDQLSVLALNGVKKIQLTDADLATARENERHRLRSFFDFITKKYVSTDPVYLTMAEQVVLSARRVDDLEAREYARSQKPRKSPRTS